jgi:hypothetical protein
MTMAPGKKRSFWVEILFISILLFLLIGARSQSHTATEAAMKGFSSVSAHPAFGPKPVL